MLVCLCMDIDEAWMANGRLHHHALDSSCKVDTVDWNTWQLLNLQSPSALPCKCSCGTMTHPHIVYVCWHQTQENPGQHSVECGLHRQSNASHQSPLAVCLQTATNITAVCLNAGCLQVKNQHSRSDYHQQWMETATEVQKEHQRELLGMRIDKRSWRGSGWREAARSASSQDICSEQQ